ncbi:MAG: hypothetical protein IJ518_06315, partial [Clostridia bacterium]|nr:hypothetical protein [Clostridia bacterium]
MKKLLSLVLTLALMASAIFSVLPIAVSAAETGSIVLVDDNYNSGTAAVGSADLSTAFPSIVANTNARLLYDGNAKVRFLCTTGSGVVSATYKVDIPEGNLDS